MLRGRHREPVGDERGQAEVQNLDLSGFGHEDIGRLEIAVHDTGRVRGREGIGDLDAVAQHVRHVQCLAVDHRLERATDDALHGQVISAIRTGTDVEDRDDVGMLKGRRQLRFLDEPSASFGVGDDARQQDLQRDDAVQSLVAGTIDLTHPARADEIFDHVRAEPRARFDRHAAKS